MLPFYGANTTRLFVLPTTLGIEHRIVNGRVYITAIPVTDPDEIGRRAAIFSERAGYYYQNWDRLYEGWKTRIAALISEIEAITVPPLDEFEDPRVVMESTGVAQNHYVRENFHRCLDLFSKMWHHHTEFLMLGYGAYVVFFEFCKNAFPEISEQTVARMVAGIDRPMSSCRAQRSNSTPKGAGVARPTCPIAWSSVSPARTARAIKSMTSGSCSRIPRIRRSRAIR